MIHCSHYKVDFQFIIICFNLFFYTTYINLHKLFVQFSLEKCLKVLNINKWVYVVLCMINRNNYVIYNASCSTLKHPRWNFSNDKNPFLDICTLSFCPEIIPTYLLTHARQRCYISQRVLRWDNKCHSRKPPFFLNQHSCNRAPCTRFYSK